MISPTPIDMTSTPAMPWLLLTLLIGYGIAATVGDGITTMIGLGANKGFVESNPVMRWLFSKVGQSLACWISAVAYAFVAAFIASKVWGAGMLFAGGVAASETYMVIKNYLLLKKAGIPLK